MAVQEFWLDLDLKQNFIKHAKIEVVDAKESVQVGGLGIVGNKLYYNNGTDPIEIADASVVSAIRTELGTKGADVTGGDIYTRLLAVETAIGNDTSGNSLGTRVTNLENKVNDTKTGLAKTKEIADGAAGAAATAQSTASDAKTLAEKNEGAIEGHATRLTTAEDKISALEGKVGKAAAGEVAATGLFKDIADVKATADKNKTDLAVVTATANAAATKTEVTEALKGKVDVVAGSRLMTDAEGTKLEGIKAGAQVNVIEKITIDGTEASISDKTAAFTLGLSEYAKKSDITTVFTFKGTVASASDLANVVNPKEGDVYNVTAAFTDNGKTYPAGTNVVYVNEKIGDNYQLKWDALGGAVDLGAYSTTTEVETKITNATKDLATSETLTTELGKKADKLTVTGGTYTKVTVNSQGLVSEGVAKITEADIDGSIVATKLSGTIDKARLPTDIPAANIDGELADDNIPTISLAGNKVTGVLPADKLGLAAVTLNFTKGTSQTVEHGLNGVPYFVQATDAAGNTVDGVQITRTATSIKIESGVEHPALTVYAIGLRKTA